MDYKSSEKPVESVKKVDELVLLATTKDLAAESDARLQIVTNLLSNSGMTLYELKHNAGQQKLAFDVADILIQLNKETK